jgi:SOS-response transcriptional repressor LexA
MATRLTTLLHAKNGGNQSEMARHIGVSPQAVQKWLAGLAEPRGRNLEMAADYLGVTPAALKFGVSPETNASLSSTHVQRNRSFDENVVPAAPALRPIPVISSVQAGALRDMDSPYPPGAGYAYEYTDQDLSKWAFALDVEGLSMMPEFRPGDRIIIEPEIAPNPGDFVVARNGTDQATFKKYRPRGIDATGNMVFELVPLNDDYATLRSDTEHLTVIGVMTEHRKKYRRT